MISTLRKRSFIRTRRLLRTISIASAFQSSVSQLVENCLFFVYSMLFVSAYCTSQLAIRSLYLAAYHCTFFSAFLSILLYSYLLFFFFSVFIFSFSLFSPPFSSRSRLCIIIQSLFPLFLISYGCLVFLFSFSSFSSLLSRLFTCLYLFSFHLV